MKSQDILNLLHNHLAANAEEELYRQQTYQFVTEHPQNFLQENPQAHLTASSWIVNPEKTHALLIFHRKLNKWLQVGGHVENTDESLQAAALREAYEETGLEGIKLVTPKLFDIDVHLIPARNHTPAHYHHDFRFLLEVEQASISHIPTEVVDLQWFELKTISHSYLARMVQKTITLHQ